MAYRDSTAEKTTITRNVDDLEEATGNIYESIVMLSKRSNQIITTSPLNKKEIFLRWFLIIIYKLLNNLRHAFQGLNN